MEDVETVLWFPRSLWARCPPECPRGQGVHSSGGFHSTGAAHGAVAVDHGAQSVRFGGNAWRALAQLTARSFARDFLPHATAVEPV